MRFEYLTFRPQFPGDTVGWQPRRNPRQQKHQPEQGQEGEEEDTMDFYHRMLG